MSNNQTSSGIKVDTRGILLSYIEWNKNYLFEENNESVIIFSYKEAPFNGNVSI